MIFHSILLFIIIIYNFLNLYLYNDLLCPAGLESFIGARNFSKFLYLWKLSSILFKAKPFKFCQFNQIASLIWHLLVVWSYTNYTYLCPSVICPSVRFMGKRLFLNHLLRKRSIFLCTDSIIYKRLFCKYFARRSGYKRKKCKNTEPWFSRLLFKIEVDSFWKRCIWLMSIYSMNNLSISLLIRLWKA